MGQRLGWCFLIVPLSHACSANLCAAVLRYSFMMVGEIAYQTYDLVQMFSKMHSQVKFPLYIVPYGDNVRTATLHVSELPSRGQCPSPE